MACADMLPRGHERNRAEIGRAVEPIDLLELRDIGSTIDTTGDDVVALSPNKTLIAFQIRRADPVTNGYCLAMAVMEPREGARARVVDSGGELIRVRYEEVTGKADVPTGLPRVVTARWFKDGRSFAFIKRVHGSTQVWRAFVDGSSSVQLSRSNSDVTDFRISTDEKRLILYTRAWLDDAYRRIEAEGALGYLVDDRYFPIASNVPFIAAPAGKSFVTVDIGSGRKSQATQSDRDLFLPFAGSAPPNSTGIAVSSKRRRAWTFIDPLGSIPHQIHLAVDNHAGSTQVCQFKTCAGSLSGVWWSANGRTIRYIRREGWGRSLTAIYEWNPDRGQPHKLYQSRDAIFDCKPLEDDLLCLVEGSIVPRRIVRIALGRGLQRQIFDANPEFAQLAKGRVRRLQWFTAFGSEAFGDLVLPVRYRPGQRYPLIVVQYVTRGFLRGGTGDEYPIQVFANNGFAVLSIERPRSPAIAPNARSYTDLDKADLAGFLDKRNVLSAIERGVRNLVDAGIVDERRVGITGLSDGASTVQYAGVHSKMFAAAVMSNCCAEPTQLALLGPAAAKLFREVGWPDLTSEAPSFWSNISWVVNARRIPFPVLLQMADSEYRSGLAAFTALREADVAIEMRVFPNETHFKWQPIHRLSIYTRNLNWFSFWLQNDLLSSNSQSNEIARWDDLKRGYSEAIDNVGSQRQP